MKCPACWAPKAYRSSKSNPKTQALKLVGFIPMRCHHCYHKFHTWVPLTWGEKIEAPPAPQLRIAPETVSQEPKPVLVPAASSSSRRPAA